MFDHRKLDVYQLAIKFAAWAYEVCRRLRGRDRHIRDQFLRASQSIALNIAEGNGRRTAADRSNFFTIARGSALECSAIVDILTMCAGMPEEAAEPGQEFLVRIVSMLVKLAPPTGAAQE